MKKKRAIITVGISESADRIFTPYLERFERTFREHGSADIGIWDKSWPKGSPKHSQCHYAFKYFAFREAQERGYESVLWCDSSCSAFASIAPMWERLEKDGHVLIDDDNALGKWSSDHSLAEFDMTRDAAMELKLMCGTCIGLDLTTHRSRIFLNRMLNYARPEFFNGTHVSRSLGQQHPRQGTEGSQMSSDPRCWGHRSDEVFSSLLANELKMKTHVGGDFIGGGDPTSAKSKRACIRSGYDLPKPETK